MDSTVVNKGIRTEIRPLLVGLGFSTFTARTAWRYEGQRVDVINFQSYNSYNAEVLKVTTYSFSINLGCFYLDVPYSQGEIKTKDGVPRPEEYSCPFRGRLRRSFSQLEHDGREIWYVDKAGRYLEKVLHDARMVIARDLPPWFDRVATHDAAFRILQSEGESMERSLWGFGRMNSPHRNYLIGYFALRLGNSHLARRHLTAALASGCYDHLRPRLEADIQGAG